MTHADISNSSMATHPDLIGMREHAGPASAGLWEQAAAGLAFLAGGYAAISPWVVGFRTGSPALAVTDLIVGVAVMVLALGFTTSYTRALAWVAPAAGIWLIIAPWAVQHTDHTTGLLVSNIVVGACVAVFGLAMTAGMALAHRHHSTA